MKYGIWFLSSRWINDDQFLVVCSGSGARGDLTRVLRSSVRSALYHQAVVLYSDLKRLSPQATPRATVALAFYTIYRTTEFYLI